MTQRWLPACGGIWAGSSMVLTAMWGVVKSLLIGVGMRSSSEGFERKLL